MATFGYLVLVMTGSFVGAGLGAVAHWWRAYAAPHAEKLFEDERWNAALGGADYVYERDVVRARWDEGGWWEFHSLRNLAYYVLSGAATPLLIGAWYWSERQGIVVEASRGQGAVLPLNLFRIRRIPDSNRISGSENSP
jgi:hypothetical protein